MSTHRNYKDLIAWKKSIALVKKIYELTGNFPSGEKFGFVSKMRRGVVSIPSNIAERQVPRTTREYFRFVSTSDGSLAELVTQLIIAVDLKFCSHPKSEDCLALMVE